MRGAGVALGSRTPPSVVRSPLKSVRRNNFFDNCPLTYSNLTGAQSCGGGVRRRRHRVGPLRQISVGVVEEQ